jgi:hypothetical protein
VFAPAEQSGARGDVAAVDPVTARGLDQHRHHPVAPRCGKAGILSLEQATVAAELQELVLHQLKALAQPHRLPFQLFRRRLGAVQEDTRQLRISGP